MISLNLPSFDIKIRREGNRAVVLDPLRRRWVALTPEEWVRQHFVNLLVSEKHYPATLVANEVQLSVGEKVMRADTVVYDRTLRPRMIVEYKAPTVAITQKVFDQISVYNLLLRVDYLAVSNGRQHYVCRMDYDNEKYSFLEDLPDYEVFLQNA
ncbi:MAG: type I restriction enzyme HsdR N-terminal domain-containing protein [Prevotella sp.]|jgi:virulence-associated protein VagC|nr:type I restriction enzyme HsdR N-terminal domain-containing protein [Prevotella sp.]MBR7125852.1 type I restriction enzyme HsdR N-terminal domain-containing protein [Prevotella sp.]MDY6438793.1 type I restriction enzyme HsdR N-terminal domain-containing protein [Prevotella sp.]